MWKPGANKPRQSNNNRRKNASSPNFKKSSSSSPLSSPSSSMPPTQVSSPPPSATLLTLDPEKGTVSQLSSSNKKKKALSGATMGMRFMQRRKGGGASADVVSKRQRQDKEQTDLEKKDMEWTTTNTTNTASTPDNNAKSKNNKRRRSRISGSTGAAVEESIDPKPTYDNNTIQDMDVDATESTVTSDTPPPAPVVQIATQSDMYGLSSTTQIIGRRSFQNFHKTVETSYTKALEMQEQLAVDERVDRDHITDEELLKRYEKYVKGKGDMTGDDSKRNIVGNLKNKIR